MADEKPKSKNSFLEEFLTFIDLFISLMSANKLLLDSISMAGYDLGKMDKPDNTGMTSLDKVMDTADDVKIAYEHIAELIRASWNSWEDIKDRAILAKDLYQEYKKWQEVMELAGEEAGLDVEWKLLGKHLGKQLLLRSGAIFLPWLVQGLRLMDWLKVGNENEGAGPEKDSTGKVIRYPYRGLDFNKDGVKAFFNDPGGSLKKKYLEQRSRSRAVVTEPDDLFLIRLRDFLLSLNIPAVYGFNLTDNFDEDETSAGYAAELNRTLSTWFRIPGTGSTIAFSLLRKGETFLVTPIFDDDVSGQAFTAGKWAWALEVTGESNPFIISPKGIDYPDGLPQNVNIRFTGNYNQPSVNGDQNKNENNVGPAEGTRLETGPVSFIAEVNLQGSAKKANIELRLSDGKFIMQPTDGDNFLRRILPENGLTINFNLALGYNNQRGFYLDGSGGGEITIPLNKQFGSVSIPALQLGFRKKPDVDHWMLYASLSGRLDLGPVKLLVDKLGMALVIRDPEPDETPNLLELTADFDFKPPDGIGIEIDAGGIVTGGGYLYIDRSRGEYFGVAALTIKNKIQLSAVGIIQTQVPGNPGGYSFLLLISTEFPPVQLGMGFTLSGVGGIVGINRTLQLEKLREGLFNNAIDDILFPKNVLQNPYGIISNINTIFPPAEGQYVFGLMAKLNWGPRSIISLELGLIIKFPSPVYLAIIGVLRSVIKKKFAGIELNVLELQVNFAATINFEKRFISFDATLFNSKLLQLKIEGDIALRIKYDDNPDFAVTIGGFHPDFEPPALNLPAVIRRLKVIIRSGNPEITAECYFAVTSNTVQFGIAGHFLFKKWGVEVRGALSFDALFQISPFQFRTDVFFKLSASWKGYDFASIEVHGTFSGPSPWHIKGSLKLSVWIFSNTVSLEETWGDDDETRIEQIDVLPLLIADLEDVSHWEYLDNGIAIGVALRKDPKAGDKPKELIIHPHQSVVISQSTLPLGVEIDRFAGRKPSGARKFSISLKDKAGKAIAGNIVQQHFASAQFIGLSEEEQLHLPPYELYDNGISIDGLNDPVFDAVSAIEVDYEYDVMDIEGMAVEQEAAPAQSAEDFNFALLNNSLSNAGFTMDKLSFAEKKKKTIQEKFTINDATTQNDIGAGVFSSQAVAAREIRKRNKVEGTEKTQSYFIKPVVNV